jgi:hypothetical protein
VKRELYMDREDLVKDMDRPGDYQVPLRGLTLTLTLTLTLCP